MKKPLGGARGLDDADATCGTVCRTPPWRPRSRMRAPAPPSTGTARRRRSRGSAGLPPPAWARARGGRPELGRRAAEPCDHRLLRRLSGEWELPGEQLEGEDADGVHVAPTVERLATDLLGAHELGRAEHDAGRGQLGHLGAGAPLLGQAEIHHHRAEPWLARLTGAVRQQHDVLGL